MKFPTLATLLIGNQYISIEHYSAYSQEMIAVLLIEKKKEELVILKKDKINYKGSMPEKWDKKLPFILTINTSQVIQKEVAGTDAVDEKLLHKTFPNTNWDEFYFQIWRLQTKSIIAISRKTYIKSLLEEYTQQGIIVAGINLGIASMAEIITYTERDTFITNHQTVSWNENNSILNNNPEKLETNYSINGLTIQNSYLLTFASLLAFLLQNSSNTGNAILLNHKYYDVYLQKSFFTKGFKVMIGFLLAVLLINFFVFNHYYNKSQNTDITLMLNKSSLEEISQTKQRIVSKEQKLKEVMSDYQSHSTAILNDISKSTPSSILLIELVYQPLEKKVKAEEAITTLTKTITITGTTLNNQDFTTWVETIEQLKWVNDILITHFGKNENNETIFALKITLK